MEVLTLKPGEKVTKPGIYAGIDLEAYHGDICDGPSISSSGLRLIDSRSPAHYWAQSYLNPKREPREHNDAFDFGHAAHVLLLGEAGFRDKFAIRPERWSDWRTKDAQAWRREMQEAGRIVLTPEQVEGIRRIASVMAADPLIQAGLLQGDVERSLFWKDEITGVWLKSRPDVLPVSDGMAADLKTTTDASPDAIQRAVHSYGYHMQGSLVGDALKQVLGVEMTEFVLIWIEKSAPYAINISPVDAEWLGWGARQNRRALDTFARCVESGQWPAYPSEITTSMPEWLRKSFEAQDKFGLLPSVEGSPYKVAAE